MEIFSPNHGSSEVPACTMRSVNPHDGAASPAAALCYARFPMSFVVPKTLSLNMFYRSQQSRPGRLRMGNCRNIEVVLLCPLYPTRGPILEDDLSLSSSTEGLFAQVQDLESHDHSIDKGEKAKMAIDQEQERGLNLIGDLPHGISFAATSPDQELENAAFRFLDLPLELRLKIYSYLLPPRTHTIVTQIPYNGYFYNTSTIPVDSATSFYPFGRSGPITPKEGYTTYKVLTTNFRTDFPAFSIHPELFLIDKQIHAEAEPILYGNSNASWDFGVHLDALLAFWGNRSEVARKCVKNVRIAREIPFHLSPEYSAVPDPLWSKTCDFIKNEMVGLRSLDLTMWSSTGSDAFSSALWTDDLDSTSSETDTSQMEAERRLHDWEWTSTLLAMPSLKQAKVTWWGFQSSKAGSEAGSVKGFDSWIAGRMAGDRLVRDRMVRDGIVVEGVVVVRGLGA